MSQPDTLARHETNGTHAEAAPSGRDGKGRFTKGNPGGPGNPFARQVARLRQVFLDRVDPDKLQALVDKLLEMALAGDLAALKLVLAYTLGRPAPAVDPDGLDAQEIELFRREQVRDLDDNFRAIPAGFACEVLRAGMPVHAEKCAESFVAQNNALNERQRLEKERLDKEAARRQQRKEKEAARRQARKAQREARGEKDPPRPAHKRTPKPEPVLPTVEQILAWARQGPQAAPAEAPTVNKPDKTDGGSPNPSQ